MKEIKIKLNFFYERNKNKINDLTRAQIENVHINIKLSPKLRLSLHTFEKSLT